MSEITTVIINQPPVINLQVQQPPAMSVQIQQPAVMNVQLVPGNANPNIIVSSTEPLNPPLGLIWIQI